MLEPVSKWLNENRPDRRMHFVDKFAQQIEFVRDMLPTLITNRLHSFPEYVRDQMRVIAQIVTNGITVPIIEITHPSGLKFLVGFDFFTWAVTVESPKPISADFGDLFHQGDQVHWNQAEGFPEERIYPPYAENHSNFTVWLKNEYEVYTFFWIVGKALGLRNKK